MSRLEKVEKGNKKLNRGNKVDRENKLNKLEKINNVEKDDRVHNPKRRYEYALKHIHRADVCKENKNKIEKFAEHCLAEGIGELRAVKYIYTLIKIAQILDKDFERATKEDIERVICEIEKSNYSDWTKHDFRITIKKFYKWLKGNGEEYPPEVKWIKSKKNNKNNKIPEELITAEEVKILVENADNLRDKAMLLTLYESGARVGELLNMKIKHIEFDKYGGLVVLQGKTGMRRVRLIASVPAISAWLSAHPFKNDPDAWLWCSLATNYYGKRLTYALFNRILKDIAKKSGIRKKIYPHLFRHSRATELAKNLTEAQLCQIMGWVQSSKQVSTYVHLSQRDTDKAILGMYGLLEKEEGEKEKLLAVRCPRCKQNNYPGAKFCYHCGMALDLKAAIEAEDVDKQVGASLIEALKDPEVAGKIIKALEEFIKQKQSV